MANRSRDLIFEALATASGASLENLTASERGRINAAALELREWLAKEITIRAGRWGQVYANATLTPQALCAHWERLGGKPPAVSCAGQATRPNPEDFQHPPAPPLTDAQRALNTEMVQLSRRLLHREVDA